MENHEFHDKFYQMLYKRAMVQFLLEVSSMAVNLRDPEERRKETIKVSKLLLKKSLNSSIAELEYLILATPTSSEREAITEANIHVMAAREIIERL